MQGQEAGRTFIALWLLGSALLASGAAAPRSHEERCPGRGADGSYRLRGRPRRDRRGRLRSSRGSPMRPRRSAPIAGVRPSPCRVAGRTRREPVRRGLRAGRIPAAAPGGISPTSSEDCLFLNVWRPAAAAPEAKLPVMVWIHGGAFVFGSGSWLFGGPVRQAGRHPRHLQLPPGTPRLLRLPRAEPRASGRAQGQLRLHGPDRGPRSGCSGTSPRSEAIRTTSRSSASPRAASRCTRS